MNPDDAAERTDPDGHADGHADVAMGPFGAPVFAFVDQAQAAVSAMQALAAGDTRGLDDESLLGMFDAAELIDRYFASVHFAVLAELDARDLTDRRFGHAPATQAGWRHGADRRRVNRDLHCSERLRRHLPAIADALARGEVPVDRVRELVRHLNDRNQETLGEMQEALLAMLGARSTFRQFANDVEHVARLVDQDGTEPPLPRDCASVDQSGDKVTATFEMHGSRCRIRSALKRRSGPPVPRSDCGPRALLRLRGSSPIRTARDGAGEPHRERRRAPVLGLARCRRRHDDRD